jgi:uncharacterized protein (TIGR03437 family)
MNRVFTRTLLCLVVSCGAAFAQTRMSDQPSGQASGKYELETGSGSGKLKRSLSSNGRREVRAKDGSLRFLEVEPRVYRGDSDADIARQILSDYRLRLDPSGRTDGNLSNVQQFGEEKYLKFRQTIDGIPVARAEAVAVLRGDAFTEIHSSFATIRTVEGDWNLTAQQARQKAEAFGRVESAEKIYVVEDSTARTAWRLSALATKRPHYDWLLVFDGTTGELIEKTDLRAGQRAQVFPSNPVVDRGQLTTTTLQGLTGSGVLTGRNAKIYSYLPNLLGLVAPEDKTNQIARADASGNFVFGVDDPRFSEVQLYDGLHRVAERFRALGYRSPAAPLEALVWFQDFDRQTGDFFGQNNAFFSPNLFDNRGGLHFYLTRRGFDTAVDNDIVFHEYTHSVVNSFVLSAQQGTRFRALNEGFADYFSSTFLDDPNLAEWGALIFSLRTPFLRTVKNTNTYPVDFVGEEHLDGNIWSGTLWDVRTALGPDRSDRIVFGALARLTGSAEFFDAAVALVASAKALYGDAIANTVADIAIRRGIGTDTAAVAADTTPVRSAQIVSGSIPAAAPGVTLIAAQQFRIDVPASAARLRVEVSSNVAVRAYVRFRVPVVIESGRILFEQQSTSGTSINAVLDAANSPELQAGTYYVVLANVSQATANYQLRLTAEASGSPEKITVIPMGGSAGGSAPSGRFLATRQFEVDVPATFRTVTITLRGSTDVDLYVSYAAPIGLNSQGFPEADIVSGTADSTEVITISSQTMPNLRAGKWRIAVYNYEAKSTEFSVTVTGNSGALPGQQQQALAANTEALVQFPAAQGAAVLGNWQYFFDVPDGATALNIESTGTLDTDILIRVGSPVEIRNGAPTTSFRFSPLQTPKFRIARPDLKTGRYFVTAANLSPTAGSISVKYTLEFPANRPIVSAGGVANAFSFQAGLSYQTWSTVFGSNFTTVTRDWTTSVQGNRLPQSIENVSVLVNGIPATIYFISPSQINFLPPSNLPDGDVEVVVRNANGTSDPIRIRKTPALPAFYAPFTQNSRFFVTAVALNGDYVCKPGVDPRARRGARPGEVLQVFATGLGATQTTQAHDVIPSGAPAVVEQIAVTIGGRTARLFGNGNLVAPGLYQVNVEVPAGLAAGDYEMVISVGRVATSPAFYLNIQP